MRNELEYIERIERYLLDELPAPERAAFDAEVSANAELQTDLAIQQEIMSRMSRRALREEVEAAQLRFDRKAGGFLKGGGLFLSTILLLIGAISFVGWYSGWLEMPDLGSEIAVTGATPEPMPTGSGDSVDLGPVLVPPIVLALQPRFNRYLIDPTKRQEIIDSISGSRIVIPALMLVDSFGRLVRDSVEICYREFRNKADFLFNGVSMSYATASDTFLFNSAGQFELRAYRANTRNTEDEEAVFYAGDKPMEVDFVVTEELPDAGFYKFEDEHVTWEDFGVVEYAQTEEEVVEDDDVVLERTTVSQEFLPGPAVNIASYEIKDFDGNGTLEYWDQREQKYVPYDPEKFGDRMYYSDLRAVTDSTSGEIYRKGSISKSAINSLKMVKGLQISSFGLHNIDQIYRPEGYFRLKIKLADQSGTPLNSRMYMATIVDLSRNAAYPYKEDRIEINPEGASFCVVTMEDGTIWYYGPQALAQHQNPDGKRVVTFRMQDITNDLRRVSDVQVLIDRATAEAKQIAKPML